MEFKELTLDELCSINGGSSEAFELGKSHGRASGKAFFGAMALIGVCLFFNF